VTTLKQLLGAPAEKQPGVDPFLARYGLLRNPFPPARTIIPEIMYNQEQALHTFADRVRETIAPEPQRRSMGVVAGTGGGKTHFLRHCQYLIREYTREVQRNIVAIEFTATTSSMAQLLREVLRKTDEACKDRGEYDLLTELIRKLGSAEDLGSVKQTDLRAALQLLKRSTQNGFTPPDRNGVMKFDHLKEIAKRWLYGATLTQAERRYLGVFSRLASPSLMTRVISELLTLSRERGIFEGVMVCLDEIETLFTSGISTGKVQGFLQDLHYFFDEAVRDEQGYSLLILSGSTQNGTANLRDFNYPLFQRLGFEGEARAELQPIESLEEVQAFAKVYVDYERTRAGEQAGDLKKVAAQQSYRLLTEDELREAHVSATATTRAQQARIAGRVNQAQLLEALHSIVERKRHAAADK
jgi:hypothetical protein